MSVREIAALLFRHLGLVLAALLLPLVLAAALFLVAPKSYQADAKVLVSGRDATPSTALQPGAEAGPATTAEESLNSEVELLTGRELAERTVAAVGAPRLFPDLKPDRRTGRPDPDAVNAAFAHSLSVKAVPNSRVINISLLGPSPQVATQALSAYLDQYQQLHRRTFSRPVAGLLREQLAGYEGRLRAVEARIAAFTEEKRLFDPEQERKNLLDTRSSLFNTTVQLRTHADELAARVGSLQSVRAATPTELQVFPQGDESDAMQRARAQILELQQQATKLRANYQPGSRAVRDLEAQIASARALLAAETARFAAQRRPERNPLYDELTAETARARVQVGPERDRARAIDAQMGGVDRRLSELAQAEQVLAPLQRERAEDVATVAAYRQRLADATVAENLDRQRLANVQVIQPASAAALHRAVRPKLMTYLLGGAAAGLVLAAGVVGVLFARKNTFLAPESVEARTRVPVLVSLPTRAG